jgi:hypothetical protein
MRTGVALIVAVAVTVAGSVIVPPAAEATAIELSTAQGQIDPGNNNQGWWTAAGPANQNTNDNYVVGEDDEGREYRDFSRSTSGRCRAS